MSRGITDRQRAVLRFIQDFIAKEHFPPTLREIGNHFGMKSTNGVNDHLVALEKKGFIKRRSDISRGIEVLHPENRDGQAANPVVNVPVLRRFESHTDLSALRNIERYVVVDMTTVIVRPEFAVVAKNSIDESVREGDTCLVRLDEGRSPDDVVAISYGGDISVTTRREAETHPRTNGAEYRILGKVVTVIRNI